MSSEGSSRFPVYQIEFSAVASGKHIAASKRRLLWRFGFPNKEALDAGKVGIECRGEEHEVSVVWSVASGKKQIIVDSKLIHTSSNRSAVLDFTWNMKGLHIMKITAQAKTSTPPNNVNRQYDFFVDGQSFFNMPKAYELGLKGPVTAHARVPGVFPKNEMANRSTVNRGYAEGDPTSRQEEQDIQLAIKASIEESRKHLAKTAGTETPKFIAAADPTPSNNRDTEVAVDLLMDFSDTPAHNQTSVVSAPVQSSNQWGNVLVSPHNQTYDTVTYASNQSGPSFASQPAIAGHFNQPPPAQSYQVPVPQTIISPHSYQVPQTTSNLPPTDLLVNPSHITHDPFAPKPVAVPTYNDIHSQILQTYQTDSVQVNSNFTPNPSVVSETFSVITTNDTILSEEAQFNNASATQGLTVETNENKNDVDKAMGKLVNLMDLNSPASTTMTESKLTMNPLASPQKGTNGFAGPKLSLGEMKALKSMQSPSGDGSVGSGSLVVSGQQGGNFGYGNGAQMNQSNGPYNGAPGMDQQQYGNATQPNVNPQYAHAAPAGNQQHPGYTVPVQMQQSVHGMGTNQHR